MGTNIREIREKQGVKQYELAARAGIPPYRVSFLERGLVKPRHGELEDLAAALRVSVRELTQDRGSDE